MSFLPEFAIQLIGRHRIARHAPVRDQFFNNVWRVTTHDDEELVVRRMVDGQAFARENAALMLLSESGLPAPTVMARGATVMVYRASAGEPMTFPDEGLLRQSGYALRRLHGLGRAVPTPDACPQNPAPIERVVRRAPDLAGPQALWCPTHGDLEPGNVLVGLDRNVVHLLDFETFAPGDPLVDLMIACIAFATRFPAEAGEVVRLLQRGYFDGLGDEALLKRWCDAGQRTALAEVCLEESAAWAEDRLRPDRAEALRAGRRQALDAIARPFC